MAVGGIILVALMATTAIGAPVETADTDTDSAGALDIDKVSHDHDATNITYTLTTEDTDPYAVAGSTPATLEWALDFDDATPVDACVEAVVDTSATLTARLLDGACDSTTVVTDTVTIARTTNVFTVTLPLSVLEEIEEFEDDEDDEYGYRVTATSTPNPAAAAIVDDVPDAAAAVIEHSLAAAASPTPDASATPTASPLASDDASASDDDTTTTSDDDDSGSGEVLSSTTTSAGGTESGTLPATGDVADTSQQAWPVAVGLLAVVIGLGLGSVLAYRLVIEPSRR
jgi:hypothetical protein